MFGSAHARELRHGCLSRELRFTPNPQSAQPAIIPPGHSPLVRLTSGDLQERTQMSGPPVQRDLRPLIINAGESGCTKMAAATAATQPHAAYTDRAQDLRQVLAPVTLTYSQVAQNSPHPPQAPSPASTESLLGLTMEEYAMSPAGPSLPHLHATPSPGLLDQDPTTLKADLICKISDLLERGLANTAAQIISNIKSDFANLGTRMEAIENKLDITVSRANQNTAHIQVLQDQLGTALSRTDDLENSSRRYNF